MLKVMIVDDEIHIRQGLFRAIDWNRHGFAVTGLAEDGVEALELYGREKTDLIITDIKMPRMDGLELCKKLKEMETGVKLLLISGYSDFAYARQAIQYGVADYLLKPLDFSELEAILDKIRSQLDKRQTAESKAIPVSAPLTDKRITQVHSYIQSNYAEELNLKRLADLFHFNPVYLGQLFKSQTGKYFHDYIHEVRVNSAILLLQDSSLSIDEISTRVGYKNGDHFYKSFKKVTGMIPGEYRKKFQEHLL